MYIITFVRQNQVKKCVINCGRNYESALECLEVVLKKDNINLSDQQLGRLEESGFFDTGDGIYQINECLSAYSFNMIYSN